MESSSSVSTMTRLRRWDDRGWIPTRGRKFFFATATRPAIGPTQPPIQWVPRLFPRG